MTDEGESKYCKSDIVVYILYIPNFLEGFGNFKRFYWDSWHVLTLATEFSIVIRCETVEFNTAIVMNAGTNQ